jgi:uncharacterized iron-regulated membrane protein
MSTSYTHAEPQQTAYQRSLLWRIHFWAALVATPFTLVAVLTGLVYVFTPQIEQALYGHLDKVEPMDSSMLTLDTMVHSAHGAVPPGWRLHAAVPPHQPDASAQVVFTPPESVAGQAATAEHMHGGSNQTGRPKRAGFGWPAAAVVVYVNPYTAEVLGQMPHQDRFNQWAKRLHSRLLQCESWRWMIELAASWMVVMLITGIYLWWPQENAVIAASGQNQRSKWKRWHSWTGVSLALVSLVILATGLTWSKYAGGIVRDLRDLSGQAPPVMPANLVSTPQVGMAAMDWQSAWEATKRHAPDISFQLMPPSGPQDIWRATQHDRSQPTKRFDLALDAYSAQPLYLSGWQQQTTFGQATAIGIPFHRGELGWWNQAVLAIFGVGLLFSLVSGWVMFFKREQTVWKLLLSGPPMRIWRSMPAGFWVTASLMMALMPLLALSAACLLAGLYVLRRPDPGA